jgi:hypothetical protein
MRPPPARRIHPSDGRLATGKSTWVFSVAFKDKEPAEAHELPTRGPENLERSVTLCGGRTGSVAKIVYEPGGKLVQWVFGPETVLKSR